MKPKLKPKMIVSIFHDSDVCKHYEGQAELIECTYFNKTHEFWIVKFLETEKEVQRVFVLKNLAKILFN